MRKTSENKLAFRYHGLHTVADLITALEKMPKTCVVCDELGNYIDVYVKIHVLHLPVCSSYLSEDSRVNGVKTNKKYAVVLKHRKEAELDPH